MQRVVFQVPRSFEIIAASCEHEGSIMCYYEGLEKTIDYIASADNRFLIKLGDNIEAICTDDKRYNQPPAGMKELELAIPLKQAFGVIERYKRISSKIITVLSGNHERTLGKYGNLAELIADGLGTKYGTEHCRIVLENNGKHLFNIQAMHGRKLFKSNAKDYEQQQANKRASLKLYLQDHLGNAAIHLCGHAHQILIVAPSKRLYMMDGENGVKQAYLSEHSRQYRARRNVRQSGTDAPRLSRCARSIRKVSDLPLPLTISSQATSQGSGPSSASKKNWLKTTENAVVSVALLAMVLIPLAESFLRRIFQLGIPASTAMVQHLVLLVGMLGGAIAAREGRLLSLSTLGETSLHGRWKRASQIFTNGVSAAVTAFLCLASYQFVASEREGGQILAYGIPMWVIESVLPIGFAVIAIRVLLHTSEKWGPRAAAALCALLLVGVVMAWPGGFHHSVAIAMFIMLVASVLGVPAFVSLGGVALILFWGADQPIAAIPVAHYSLVTNPSLPTLPLFTLAGYFLAEGGAPKRLVRAFYALFGQFRGGPAIVTVIVCALFTSFTGASGVTILALGGLLMPVLLGARYSEKDSLGLLTGSGSLGLLLPPCLPLIVYAIVANVPIKQMFLGGIIPALVMMTATAIWGIRRGSVSGGAIRQFEWQEARIALWDAKWELATPVVASIALFSGIATPVEAAAVTAFYAFLTAAVFHRDLRIFRDVPRVMAECGLLIGGVLLILGVSLGFTNYLVDAEVPTHAVAWTTQHIHSPIVFLLLLNVFLLVVGCLMEIYPAIVVEVPLLVPLGLAYHIDPVRLGIIFLANMELGYLTPPVGLNLLMSSYRFKKPVPEILRSVLPVVMVMILGVLLITYIPALTTVLPRLFGY